jgi:hypothetical protein
MTRLAKKLSYELAESDQLTLVIKQNLKGLGYGD